MAKKQQKKAKVISLVGQRGGSGKTTTAVKLADLLAQDAKVLLIDLDPQAHASAVEGYDLIYDEISIADVLRGSVKIKDAIRGQINKNYEIIPANIKLSVVAEDLYNQFKRESILKDSISSIKKDFSSAVIFLTISTNDALVFVGLSILLS